MFNIFKAKAHGNAATIITEETPMTDTATPAPKKTKKAPAKPKAKTPATKAPATKAPAPKPVKPAPEPKPEPILVDGFEVKADADVKAIKDATATVAKATQAIADKETDLLGSYLTLGEFAATVAPMFKSTKLYGQYLAEKAPASTALDAPLRSNCKWLYEALNDKDHAANDLLTVLGVNRIEDYKSGNPTVIKRNYSQAKKEADKIAELKDKGIDPSDEDAIKAVEAEEKKKDEAATKRKITKAIKNLVQFANEQTDKEDALAEVGDVLKDMFTDQKNLEAQLQYLIDLK